MGLSNPTFLSLYRDLQHLHQHKHARRGHKGNREGWEHCQPDTYSELVLPVARGSSSAQVRGLGCDWVLSPSMLLTTWCPGLWEDSREGQCRSQTCTESQVSRVMVPRALAPGGPARHRGTREERGPICLQDCSFLSSPETLNTLGWKLS